MARPKREPKFQAPEDDVKQTVSSLGDPENLVKLGRYAATDVMSVCASALLSLNMIPKKGLGTFATDKYYRMYYDPEVTMKWFKEATEVTDKNPCGTCGATSHHPIAYIGGVICHEVWHPLRKHYARSESIHAHHGLWNMAGDCEINDDILEIFKSAKEADLCLPPGGCMPSKFGLKDGRMAEEYYAELRDQADEQRQKCENGECGHGEDDHQQDGDGNQPGQNGNPGWGACGSGCSGGEAKDYEEGPPSEDCPGVSEAEADCIERETAEAIQQASATRGTMPAGMERWADKTLKPAKADWRQLLKQACRWASGRQRGEDIRTYRRLGRRTACLGGSVIFPTTYSPAPYGAIVWDTSGSMDDYAMSEAANECDSLFRQLGVELAVYTVDSDAGPRQNVTSLRDIKFTGGGGTDMRVGINAAMEGKPVPGFVVVFTDGWTPWPSEPLPYGAKLIICLVGQHACDTLECPEWATTIKIFENGVEVKAA